MADRTPSTHGTPPGTRRERTLRVLGLTLEEIRAEQWRIRATSARQRRDAVAMRHEAARLLDHVNRLGWPWR